MPRTFRAGDLAGPFPLFAAFSLVAVAVGCFVARANGAPASEWARSLAAWLVGGLLAGGLARWTGPRTALAFLIATPLALGLTLLSGGQDGVHRWVQLGPLRMNVAELLLPAAIVACMGSPAGRRVLPGAAAAVALLLAAIEPDAAQATAYGGALIVLVASAEADRAWRVSACALAAVALALAWLKPDSLAPVPDVEGIMRLAWAMSPIGAVVAWGALGGAVLAPLAAARTAGAGLRAAALALATYGALSSLAPLVGAFPVPLVGMGMSPILGLWLGMGLLAAIRERAAP